MKYQLGTLADMHANKQLPTSSYTGEKLETADKQRARAVLSKKLMEYFMQFNEGRCPTLDSLMTQQGLEGQVEAARILRQLAILAKEVDLPDTQVVWTWKILRGRRFSVVILDGLLTDVTLAEYRRERELKSSGSNSRRICCLPSTKHTGMLIQRSWR